MDQNQEINKVPDNGKLLILSLKDNIKYLIQNLHHSSTNKSTSTTASPLDSTNYLNINFDESNEYVLKVCDIIERIFLFSIKIKEFQSTIPLWGFFQKLAIISTNENKCLIYIKGILIESLN